MDGQDTTPSGAVLEADSEDKTPPGVGLEAMQEALAAPKRATAVQPALGRVCATLPGVCCNTGGAGTGEGCCSTCTEDCVSWR